MVIANKSDMHSDAVAEDELTKFLENNKITLFREVSAKTGSQVT